jgi:hypothetical protein
MLTIFAAPKPFRGHIAVIQRNAIRSWTLLRPACDVILLGNEAGIAEVAAEYGARHIPDVERTASGTPLISGLFKQAERTSDRDIFCYVNSDIILMSDFIAAIQRVVAMKRRFLLVGHRWNLDVTSEMAFESGWEKRLRQHTRAHGALAGAASIDFFVFPRGVLGEIPPFAVGRPRWDNWMLFRARSLAIPLIDATAVVMAVHQNHDYAHHPEGKYGTRHGDEALNNETLAGDALQMFALTDATHVLTPTGLPRAYDREHVLRYFETLPILHPWWPLRMASKAASASRAFRSRFGLTLTSMRRRSEL